MDFEFDAVVAPARLFVFFLMAPVVHLRDAASFRACCAAENAGERFIVVDFTASWCGPWKMIAPHVEALAQEFDPAVVTVAKVDVDENREVAAHYNIQSMPTFLFFRHGEVLFSFGGADPGKLRSSLSTLMANAFDKYTGGTNVIAHGLKSAAKYNGAHGKVERFDWKCDRYVVRFDGADAPVSLRPANLMPVVACDPVPDSPSDLLPGERGVLDGISDDGTKYVVKRDSKGDKVQISPGSALLAAGTVVLIDGLVAGAKYNGKYGKIESFDASASRYSVQIRSNKRIKVKPANIYATSMNK